VLLVTRASHDDDTHGFILLFLLLLPLLLLLLLFRLLPTPLSPPLGRTSGQR